jgi:hypothetical protein
MRGALQINIIFPIKDAASARVMLTKAEYLRQADVIDDNESRLVAKRAADALIHEHADRQQAWAYARELAEALP